MARGLPLALSMWVIVAVVFVNAAGAALAARPGPAPSRRVLAAVIALLVPLAGPLLAALVRRARGGALACELDTGERSCRPPSALDVHRLAELPSVLDRLMAPEPSERLAALVSLAGASDARAIALLRWALEHAGPEIVLDAALTLEELDLRREANLEAAARRFRESPCTACALALADAAALGVTTGLADGTAAPVLAEQARRAYQLVLEFDPGHAAAIDERLARLELAAGRPVEALACARRALDAANADSLLDAEILRDHAAFAARRFEHMSEPPAAPVAVLAAEPVATRSVRFGGAAVSHEPT